MSTNTKSANGKDIDNPERYIGETTFAGVRQPGKDKTYPFGPHGIVFDLGTRIWIWDDTVEDLPEGIVLVNDGITNGRDYHGQQIVSVPIEWCYLYNDEEAEGIMKCIEADNELLRNAK